MSACLPERFGYKRTTKEQSVKYKFKEFTAMEHFAMVIPELKCCPSKVHTQIRTKFFRKLAVQS